MYSFTNHVRHGLMSHLIPKFLVKKSFTLLIGMLKMVAYHEVYRCCTGFSSHFAQQA